MDEVGSSNLPSPTNSSLKQSLVIYLKQVFSKPLYKANENINFFGFVFIAIKAHKILNSPTHK